MFRRPFRLVWLIYIIIIIGVAVGWDRGYITVHLLKPIVSALLAILLWRLVLLGVSQLIHEQPAARSADRSGGSPDGAAPARCGRTAGPGD